MLMVHASFVYHLNKKICLLTNCSLCTCAGMYVYIFFKYILADHEPGGGTTEEPCASH